MLIAKFRAVARGTLVVDGRRVALEVAVEPGTGRFYPRRTILGIDANGDGEIAAGPLDGERFVGIDEEVVARVGRRTLALTGFDERTHTIEFSPRPSAAAPVGLAHGTRLPDLAFVDLDGRRRSLGEYPGSVLLVVFWASWCAPCVDEMPALEDLANRYAGRGLVLLGVSGDESNDAAAAAVRRLGTSWPQAAPVAEGASLRDAFRVWQFPTHVLVGRDGRVVTTSSEELRGAALERSILRALDEPPPKRSPRR
jgi:thiol-disulfide isomerase/thioredoxin